MNFNFLFPAKRSAVKIEENLILRQIVLLLRTAVKTNGPLHTVMDLFIVDFSEIYNFGQLRVHNFNLSNSGNLFTCTLVRTLIRTAHSYGM